VNEGKMKNEITEGTCLAGTGCRSTCMVDKNIKGCSLSVEGEKRYIAGQHGITRQGYQEKLP
jgi:hypothetical protein